MSRAGYRRKLRASKIRRRYQREENIMRGLRYDGNQRILRRWPALHGLPPKIQKVARQRLQRRELQEAGLTIEGKARVNKLWKLDGLRGRERERVRVKLWKRERNSVKPSAMELTWGETRAAMGDVTIPDVPHYSGVNRWHRE